MAAILSQYSTAGFYNAPVTKGLLGCLFLTCTSLHFAWFSHLRNYITCKLAEDLLNGQIWRIASSKIAFIDGKDFFCGALLIYYFRIFERRYGSHKFASSIVALQVITTFLEILAVLLLQWFGFDLHDGGYLPPGPYGLIFPLFVNYFCDIPRINKTSIVGIPITAKTFTYLVGLQVCSTSGATFVSALCGIAAGIIHRYNIAYVRNIPWVPSWLALACEATVKRFLASSSPTEGPVGATLEIQRLEQMDLWEQQMLMSREREFRSRAAPNGRVQASIPNIAEERREHTTSPSFEPAAEHVETLVEMGFERQRVLNALQTCQNDVNSASNLLLQES